MNRSALLALLLGIATGLALIATPWAAPLARLVGGIGIVTVVGVALLPLVALLRRLPGRLLLFLGMLALFVGTHGLYLLLRAHWATPWVLVLPVLALVAALWSVPLRLPRLGVPQARCLAALCGFAVVVQWSAFAPRELVQGIKRWRHEPATRTPLGVASHTGLLFGLGFFPLLGMVALSSSSGSGETART